MQLSALYEWWDLHRRPGHLSVHLPDGIQRAQLPGKLSVFRVGLQVTFVLHLHMVHVHTSTLKISLRKVNVSLHADPCKPVQPGALSQWWYLLSDGNLLDLLLSSGMDGNLL